jgi:NAD-dependent DNA ligase
VTKEELGEVEGFKDKMIDKIYTQIHKRANEASLLEYMVGSNKFGHGMGERKIKKILDDMPDIIYQYIEKRDIELINKIIELEGFDKITATQFVKGMGNFLKLLNEIPNEIQHRLLLEVQVEEVKGSKMEGLKVVFSGFRNKEWEKKIVSLGGEVSTSVSKNTKILVTTEEDIAEKTNSKVTKAFELGVQVLSKEQFEAKYMK